MTQFLEYAAYYDLLYSDKDYAGEAAFVLERLGCRHPDQCSLLDLGCGTCRHTYEFVSSGMSVTAVDQSPQMLALADERLAQIPDVLRRPVLLEGDVRTLRLNRKFQYVVSLFHVFSYQTSNEHLRAAFSTVAKHLAPGGRFLFDFWYGPAVLTHQPEVRLRRLERPDFSLIRIAEPTMRPNDNCVDVEFEVLLEHKGDSQITRVMETHRMRYLFLPEISDFLAHAGLRLLDSGGWPTQSQPGTQTWYVWVTACNEYDI